ncbi:hypothetical protein V2J52_13295 [Georgenia sp. MJ173]|uniref:hypothetical protein n=1 Tax=Georgenia sunbinii TaxID=3117728 RepID=UPI002F2676F0
MATITDKRIPAGVAAPNGDQTDNRVGHHVPVSVPQTTDIPLLNTMNARGQRIATAYYESGVVAGIEMGRRQAEEEMAQLWRNAHAVVQAVARRDPYDVLADRRGDRQRADRQRQLLRERQIA